MANQRILVVDDEPAVMRLCEHILARQGYAPRGTTSGQEAIALLRAEPWDLLVVDIKMPDVDGLEVLRHAREVDPNTTALVITGYATLESAVQALQAGARGFVLKPFTPAELTAAVQAALEQREKEQERLRLRGQLPILEISHALMAGGDLPGIAGRLLEAVARELGCDRGVLLLDGGPHELQIIATFGQVGDVAAILRTEAGQEMAGRVLLRTGPLVMDRRSGQQPGRLLPAGHQEGTAGVFMPLRTPQKAIGLLHLNQQAGRPPFTSTQLNLLAIIGDQIATALENTRLYEIVARGKREWEETFDAIADGISIHDAGFRIVRANQALARMLGTTPRELIGRHCYEVVHRSGQPLAPCPAAQALASGHPEEFEWAEPSLGGIFQCSAYPRRDDQGRLWGVVHVLRDVTARKQAEDLIRAQRDLGLALSAAHGIEETLRLCLEAALRSSGMDCGGIYLVQPSGDLDLTVAEGLPAAFVRSTSHYDADSGNARLVLAGRPVYSRHRELGVPLDKTRQREGLQAIAIIPVSHEGRVIGCLNIASHTLDEVPASARAALEAIAAQIGSAIARAQAEEALRDSLEQTARGHRLLEALSQAAQAVQRARTPNEVYRLILDEVGRLGYRATIFDVTEDRAYLAAAHMNFESRIVRAAEKLTGLSARDYRFPLRRGGFFQRIIAAGKSVFSDPGARPIAEALPKAARPLAGRLAAALGLGQAIYAPLIVEGKAQALFTVIGTDLTAADVPAVTAFANQAAIALENARLYETARQELAERKLAEEHTLVANERLQYLLSSTAAVIYTSKTAEDYGATFISQNVTQITGHAPQEFLNDSSFWLNHVHPEDTERILAELPSIFEQDRYAYEYRFRRRDGSYIWVRDEMKLVRDGQGQPLEIVGYWVDITERKQAEEELRRRNEELIALNAIATTIGQSLELTPMLNATLDKVLEVMGMDGGWVQLLDQETATLTMAAHRGIPPEMVQEAGTIHVGEGLTGQVAQSGQPTVLDSSSSAYRHRPVAAQEGIRVSVAIPIKSQDRVLGVLVTFSRSPRQVAPQDVQLLTAVGHQIGVAVENLRLARQASEIEVLRGLDRLRSELIANVSHELRTPLGLIKLFSTTLLREDVQVDGETQREFLSDIAEETERLEKIVDNLLDLSRMESRRLALNRRPTDLGDLVQEVMKAMPVQTVSSHFLYEAAAEPLTVLLDAKRIEQVLRNLLDNAVKYSPGGGPITVRVQKSGQEAVVQVSDTGIGIPPEHLERVFERFYRVENDLTQRQRGVGLGLAVCRGIVEAHGGHIWAESTPGEGSTFFFTLPLGREP